MTRQYKASVKGISNSKHPDIEGGKPLHFNDVYTVDTDYFYSTEDIYNYIKRDMLLVLGGGYTTDTVSSVTFSIEVA